MIAIKKKCVENGNRLFDIGLKPHSKGVDFCQSKIVFFLNIIIINIIAVMINKITDKCFKHKLIIYFRSKPLSWKLNVLIYTK